MQINIEYIIVDECYNDFIQMNQLSTSGILLHHNVVANSKTGSIQKLLKQVNSKL